MKFEVVDCEFIRSETIDATHDCLLLRVPIEGTKANAIVRLDVQVYVSSLDATPLIKVLSNPEENFPKTLKQFESAAGQ